MGPEKRNSRLPDPVSRKRKKRGGTFFSPKSHMAWRQRGGRGREKGGIKWRETVRGEVGSALFEWKEEYSSPRSPRQRRKKHGRGR